MAESMVPSASPEASWGAPTGAPWHVSPQEDVLNTQCGLLTSRSNLGVRGGGDRAEGLQGDSDKKGASYMPKGLKDSGGWGGEGAGPRRHRGLDNAEPKAVTPVEEENRKAGMTKYVNSRVTDSPKY